MTNKNNDFTFIQLPENLRANTHFGKTVEVSIPITGDFTTCFTCNKPHRAFTPKNEWYGSNVCTCNFCCPVLTIHLPPVTYKKNK